MEMMKTLGAILPFPSLLRRGILASAETSDSKDKVDRKASSLATTVQSCVFVNCGSLL